MLSAFLDVDGATTVTGISGGVVVVGLGNRYRKDDGVGVVAAAALGELALPRVRVLTDVAEPLGLLDAWWGATLAVVIDAAVAKPSMPGRVRRFTPGELTTAREGLSSHTIDIDRTRALGQALGRVPDALVVFSIDVADVGHGSGLTPRVAGAVPEVVRLVVEEINRCSC